LKSSIIPRDGLPISSDIHGCGAKGTDIQMREVARELIVQPGALGERNMLGHRDLRRALMRKYNRCGGTARIQRICQEETEAFLERGGKVARINKRAQMAPGPISRPLKNLDGMALTKAVARAGLTHKNVTPHSLRRTFATWLLNRGVDRYDLMELGNWKTLNMMRHYAATQGDTLAPAPCSLYVLSR
jgi:integrase